MRYSKRIGWRLSIGLLAVFLLALAGCDGGNGDGGVFFPEKQSYRVQIFNLTNNQPLSPAAIIFHFNGYNAWQYAQPVSVEMELLAEGGDPTNLINDANSDVRVIKAISSQVVIGPGQAVIHDVEFTTAAGVRLTVAGMLVNTNDGLAALLDVSLAGLAVGQQLTFPLAALDTGTEANTETAATIPGPAAGGQGFNPARNDRNFVVIHPGVVTSDDGLPTSALNQSHRFGNPVGKLVVTRID
jgi:hypothetical protein